MQVIPDDAYPNVGTEAHDGIFHARFWRFGVWDDVYIDDFLPVIHDTVPWGARSATDENEFWVSLLEKAFARSGSLRGGTGIGVVRPFSVSH